MFPRSQNLPDSYWRDFVGSKFRIIFINMFKQRLIYVCREVKSYARLPTKAPNFGLPRAMVFHSQLYHTPSFPLLKKSISVTYIIQCFELKYNNDCCSKITIPCCSLYVLQLSFLK